MSLYYEKGASRNAFLPRAPVSRQVKTLKVMKSLKRNSQVSRPEFKSSRELKRGLSFNDLIILVLDVFYGNLEYQWTLCPALRSSKGRHFGWRSKLLAWKGVHIQSCFSIQYHFYVFMKGPFSQSLQPVCLYTFSMYYTPHKIGFISWW